MRGGEALKTAAVICGGGTAKQSKVQDGKSAPKIAVKMVSGGPEGFVGSIKKGAHHSAD